MRFTDPADYFSFSISILSASERRKVSMNRLPHLVILWVSLVGLGWIAGPTSSRAITVELAKKCRQMALQAHPTKLPGTKNSGVEAAQRSYFSQCVATDGKMQDQGSAAPRSDSSPVRTDAPPADSRGGKMPTDLSAPETVPR